MRTFQSENYFSISLSASVWEYFHEEVTKEDISASFLVFDLEGIFWIVGDLFSTGAWLLNKILNVSRKSASSALWSLIL